MKTLPLFKSTVLPGAVAALCPGTAQSGVVLIYYFDAAWSNQDGINPTTGGAIVLNGAGQSVRIGRWTERRLRLHRAWVIASKNLLAKTLFKSCAIN
jgi:hypothetical protein